MRKNIYIRDVQISLVAEGFTYREVLPSADCQLRGNEHVGGITVDTDVPHVARMRCRILFREKDVVR